LDQNDVDALCITDLEETSFDLDGGKDDGGDGGGGGSGKGKVGATVETDEGRRPAAHNSGRDLLGEPPPPPPCAKAAGHVGGASAPKKVSVLPAAPPLAGGGGGTAPVNSKRWWQRSLSGGRRSIFASAALPAPAPKEARKTVIKLATWTVDEVDDEAGVVSTLESSEVDQQMQRQETNRDKRSRFFRGQSRVFKSGEIRVGELMQKHSGRRASGATNTRSSSGRSANSRKTPWHLEFSENLEKQFVEKSLSHQVEKVRKSLIFLCLLQSLIGVKEIGKDFTTFGIYLRFAFQLPVWFVVIAFCYSGKVEIQKRFLQPALALLMVANIGGFTVLALLPDWTDLDRNIKIGYLLSAYMMAFSDVGLRYKYALPICVGSFVFCIAVWVAMHTRKWGRSGGPVLGVGVLLQVTVPLLFLLCIGAVVCIDEEKAHRLHFLLRYKSSLHCETVTKTGDVRHVAVKRPEGIKRSASGKLDIPRDPSEEPALSWREIQKVQLFLKKIREKRKSVVFPSSGRASSSRQRSAREQPQFIVTPFSDGENSSRQAPVSS
jgi:hypothetical protein